MGIDRGKSVDDREPEPTPEQLAAIEAEAERARLEAEAEHYSVDNEAWWER